MPNAQQRARQNQILNDINALGRQANQAAAQGDVAGQRAAQREMDALQREYNDLERQPD